MKKMLIVEDDFLSHTTLKRIFKKDFEVDVCETADDFYKNCSKNSYDIVIMDISLPGEVSGLDLIKEIRTLPNLMNTKIISLTAHALREDQEKIMDAGADLFLAKPVRNEVLKRYISELLD